MAHMSPSAIFSPSIARQQLTAAKDWNYVDGWLASKFNGKPPPPFERNNDTLKALLALAAHNETSDEERDLLSKVEGKALTELQSAQAIHPHNEVLELLEDALTREGRASLDAVTGTGIALNMPFADTEDIARKIVNLQVILHNLDQSNDRVAVVDKHLMAELQSVTALLEDLRNDAYQPPSDLPRQTLDYQRRKKILAAKLPELKDRVASLAAVTGTPTPTVHDVKVEEDKYKELLATVQNLAAQVNTYLGLPHDTDLARLELEGLRVELKELTRQRDGMFEGLVERESPKKSS